MSGPGSRVVAVDGPAASGKTTLARRLAVHFELDFLDTGLLYRAVARALLQAGKPFTDTAAAATAAATVAAADLDRRALRSEAVSHGASVVAAIPEVRRALLAFQRQFGDGGAGAVLAGRDTRTGTRSRALTARWCGPTPATRSSSRPVSRNARGAGAKSCRPLASRLYMTTF